MAGTRWKPAGNGIAEKPGGESIHLMRNHRASVSDAGTPRSSARSSFASTGSCRDARIMIESSPGSELIPPPREVFPPVQPPNPPRKWVDQRNWIHAPEPTGTADRPHLRPALPARAHRHHRQRAGPGAPDQCPDRRGRRGACEGAIPTSDRCDSEVRAICLRGERRPEEWRRADHPTGMWTIR